MNERDRQIPKEPSPLRARIWWATGSADFWLSVQSCNEKGEPIGEIADIKTDDPEIGQRLRDIIQAYRMGRRAE